MDVRNLHEIENLQERVRCAAQRAHVKLVTLSGDPMAALLTLKMDKFGYHPLEDRPLNLIEQLNQTFHTMVSLAAARHLLKRFPDCGGLHLNPATAPGVDVESINPNLVAAEVFAAVALSNNRKLKADLGRLSKSKAANRFVFFYSPSCSKNPGRQRKLEPRDTEVEVWALGRCEIM